MTANEAARPAARPIITGSIPCFNTSLRISWAVAPSAIRMPVSCMRRFTEWAITSVAFDGCYAPLISVQAGLIVCFAPFEITSSTVVTVKVTGQSSNTVRLGVSASAPYVIAIANQDNSINSATNPTAQGSIITLYLTGLGLTAPLSQDGSVNSFPLPVPVAPVSVYIGGNQVLPQFVAVADGLVAGITQVNLQIPVATYPSNPVNVSINGALA